MTTGEKRSLTSSLKKSASSFIESIQGDFLSYPSKKTFLDAFYTYWLNQAVHSNLAWCKNQAVVLDASFKEEMMQRIEELFAEELRVFDKKESMQLLYSLPRLRSKKKRLRKKREKLLMQEA